MLPKWIQKWINKLWIFGSLLEGLWGAKGGPPDPKGRGDRTTERGRGEVNISPRGFLGCGNVGNFGQRASKPLDAPRGLVGLF